MTTPSFLLMSFVEKFFNSLIHLYDTISMDTSYSG